MCAARYAPTPPHGETRRGPTRPQPDGRDQFEIAILCALPLEYDAVILTIDELWDTDGSCYGKAFGDRNHYTTVRMGNWDVVVTVLPGMGKVNAARAVAGLRSSFTKLKLVFLTGVCGGAPDHPKTNEEILLGDVVIGEAVVQYDLGRLYPDEFATKDTHDDAFGRPNWDVRGLLATVRTQLGQERLQQRTSHFLRQVQHRANGNDREKYSYPGTSEDRLYASKYRHRHHGQSSCICNEWQRSSDLVCQSALTQTCTETECDTEFLISRKRLRLRSALENQGTNSNVQDPAIFIGRIASGDTVMKSAEDRDRIVRKFKVTAFEMEAAGLWEEIPCIVMKGICDYADSHKNKGWQNFAAATAASATRAMLERFTRTDQVPVTVPEDGAVSLQVGGLAVEISSPDLGARWQDFILATALVAIPGALRDHLASTTASSLLEAGWSEQVRKYIDDSPRTPVGISHTKPYRHWENGQEKSLWYQVIENGHHPAKAELEDLPLSFIQDVEKRLDFDKVVDKQGVEKEHRRRSTPKRLTLFYHPPGERPWQEDDEHSDSFRTFLWCLIAQILLWRPKFKSVILGWLGADNAGPLSPMTLPSSNRLLTFLHSLLELNGAPVVLALCDCEWLMDDVNYQSLNLVSELFQGGSTRNVPFYLVMSANRAASVPKFVKPAQVFSRDTERKECLTEFQFDKQYLRRDEVSAASEGTNDWVWSHPSFSMWMQRRSALLWIEGKAGSGKSVLAKTIRTRLGERWDVGARGPPLPPISDWFYSSRHGKTTRSHAAFLRSMLGQILEQNQVSFPHYASVYRQKKRDQDEWKVGDYEKILMELASSGAPAICIVDAMDESEGGEGNFELRRHIIELMARICQSTASGIRFIVLSRYTADIDRALRRSWKDGDQLFHIVLERENWRDVTLLVDDGLARLKTAMNNYESDDEDSLYSMPRIQTTHDEAQVLARMRDFLMDNAEGVILWIKLAIQSLIGRVNGGFYSLSELESGLTGLPRDLIEFYKLTLHDLEARYSAQELEKTRKALMWVVGANSIRPLALDELFEAICIPSDTSLALQSALNPIDYSPHRIQAKTWLGFYRQLRIRCGPFLEIIIPPTPSSGSNFRSNTQIDPRFTIQLLHRTVKDFLHDPNESGLLSFTETEAVQLVQRSMKTYLDIALPTMPTPYSPVPAKSRHNVRATVQAMTNALNQRYLLEFAMSSMPEHEVMPHLLLFENSDYPPLMQQSEARPWDTALFDITLRYFKYAWRHGLVAAVTNLLAISSQLLLSWPTMLRYGGLGRSLTHCSHLPNYTALDPSDQARVTKAIDMITAFSKHERSLSWECGGVDPFSGSHATVPDPRTLAALVEGFETSHEKGKGRANKRQAEWRVDERRAPPRQTLDGVRMGAMFPSAFVPHFETSNADPVDTTPRYGDFSGAREPVVWE